MYANYIFFLTFSGGDLFVEVALNHFFFFSCRPSQLVQAKIDSEPTQNSKNVNLFLNWSNVFWSISLKTTVSHLTAQTFMSAHDYICCAQWFLQ